MHWTHEQIMEMAEAAVFNRWLAGEQPQTIAEIASEIGVSESTLRTHACGGAPKGCRTTTVDRVRAGMGAAYHPTKVWVPSEDGLRARFMAMVERMREKTDGSPRDRAEMEARGMSDEKKTRTCTVCGDDGWIDGAREVLGRKTTECPFCADVEEVENDFESDYAVSFLFGADARKSLAESCVEKRGEHLRCDHRRSR